MMSSTDPTFSEPKEIELYSLDDTDDKKKGKAKVPAHLNSEALPPKIQASNQYLNSYDQVPSSPSFISPISSPSHLGPIASSSSSASASPSATSSALLYPNSSIAVREASNSNNSSSRTSISAPTTPISPVAPLRPRYFHSRRIKKGEAKKPWLDKKNRDPREKWVDVIPIVGMVLGLLSAGILIWTGARQVVRHEYCIILDERFLGDGLLDEKIWTREAEVGGFG